MPTIKFLLQSTNNPAGIYVRLKDGRKIDVKAKTNYAINPDDWSPTKGKPKHTKNEDLKKLNAKLDDFHNKLLIHYNNSEGQLITGLWLKSFINPAVDVSKPDELLSYVDYYLTYRGTEITEGTIKKIKVIKGILEVFQKEQKINVLIKFVNLDFINHFSNFLKLKRYSYNSNAKYCRIIKTLCLHARLKGLETSSELDHIKPKYLRVPKIYLTPTELINIEKTYLIDESIDNARDWLLISCETGQRISDFMRFKTDMIRYEKNEKGILVPLIEFTQVKTKKIMTIPLSKKVLKVLKKRGGDFPREISDQKYNDYIKIACELAEIKEITKGSKIEVKDKLTRKVEGSFEKWELVTSHIGRRTFATNNYGRIPTALLIGVTGHSTEKQFLEYIGKSDSQKAMHLSEYF